MHNHTYSLPGLGSFVGGAIAHGELGKVGLAILTMIVVVVAVNVLFWRPLVAYCERYRYENTEAAEAPRSFVLDVLARSSWPRVLGRMRLRTAESLGRVMRVLGRDETPIVVTPARQRAGDIAFFTVIGGLVAYGAYAGLHYIATSPGVGLGRSTSAAFC